MQYSLSSEKWPADFCKINTMKTYEMPVLRGMIIRNQQAGKP
jgi:hypothetical protein